MGNSKRISIWSGLFASAVMFSTLASGEGLSAQEANVTVEKKKIEMSGDLAATLREAKKTGKPVVLIFGASWCTACRKFKKGVGTPEIQAFADSFHWVLVDIDRNLSVAKERGVTATPTVHILNSNGKVLIRLVGVMKPEILAEILGRVQEDPDNPKLTTEKFQEGDRTDLEWVPGGYRGSSICYANVGYGPIRMTSQSPFQALRFGLTPRGLLPPSRRDAGRSA